MAPIKLHSSQVDMLSEVEGRKKRQELRTKVISRIVKVDIEVSGRLE